MAFKVKFRTIFPALVTVSSPLTLVKTGLAYAFGFDTDALTDTLGALYAPISILNEPTIVTGSTAIVAAGAAAVAINRAAPATTGLTLPLLAARHGIPLRIVDLSTSVTDHAITITPAAGETIMRNATLVLYSNSASLAGVTLYPCSALNTWFIAP